MTGDPCRQVSSTNQMFDHAHMGGDEMPAPLDPLDRIANLERVFANGSPIPFVILAAAEMDALVEVARAARKVTKHHFDTCDLVLGLSPAYPCSCGVDTLRLALSRVDDAARRTRPEDTMPCGHPVSAVVSSEEGTSYCGECARESRQDSSG